ncbi:hypothetical protein [Geodermatophilus siccatus]|uniref:hypothetical protein n=1 Tax=Geodermatophilus siccatus TaxID=1137991 RepID=UPI001113A91F|nr:hypothetical protein [Geodermatophilus siccatus]
MRGLVEAALPARMGTPFRWLVGSSWVGDLGDGIVLAAGPLVGGLLAHIAHAGEEASTARVS